MQPVRTFLAVPVPPAVVEQATRLQRELGRALPGVRWARPESMHLTLRFFGDVDQVTLDGMAEVVLSVERLCSPFAVEVRGVGAFPSADRPRVLWLGLGGAEPLLALYTLLEEKLAAAGIPAESRPFTPHLTLGRARQRLPSARSLLEPYREVACGTLPVDRLILFESRLRPGGALHLPHTVATLGRGRER